LYDLPRSSLLLVACVFLADICIVAGVTLWANQFIAVNAQRFCWTVVAETAGMKKNAENCSGNCMKLEDQVCSLVLAKRLQELGVKRESLFYWHEEQGHKGKNDYLNAFCLINHSELPIRSSRAISAFTVAELGEMLPDVITDDEGTDYRLVCYSDDELWYCAYRHEDVESHSTVYVEAHETEAEARAKALVYLLEHKLIAP
jgi:hypothetical protein